MISCISRFAELEARCADVPAYRLLVAPRSPTSSGLHAGCMHGIRMIGGFAVAYSAFSARIDRVRVMVLRSGGAHEPRRSHDSHPAPDRMG